MPSPRRYLFWNRIPARKGERSSAAARNIECESATIAFCTLSTMRLDRSRWSPLEIAKTFIGDDVETVGEKDCRKRFLAPCLDPFGDWPPDLGTPPTQWSTGGYDWDIPIQWRVIGKTKVGTLPNELQTQRITGADGTSTESKLGCSATRTP
jgi:hypothetical protein